MTDDRLPAPTRGLRVFAFLAEIVATTLLFAAAGAWTSPDTNEPHYLTKARHHSNPQWCEGDFFLESGEAHPVFYRLMGPVAAALPLERAAWVGRWAGWLALAIGIHLALVPTVDATASFSLRRIAAAAIWSLGTRHVAASGEWVVGGCESKVFAWALVLASAGMIARGRPGVAWLLSGLATALHAVVGGWSMAACLASAAIIRLLGPADTEPAQRPRPLVSAMLVAGGLAAAAIGVVPALSLSSGVDAVAASEAVRAYVVDRFPHHLLPSMFPDGMIARHVLAVMLGIAMLMLSPPSAAVSRLAAFVSAAVAIAVAGFGISLAEGVAPDVVHRLLRFYWFRLSDGLVPLLLAVTAMRPSRQATESVERSAWQRRLALLFTAGIAVAFVVDLWNESRHWPLPWRDAQPSRADRHVQPAAWEDVCRWVRSNTPADATFLTPRGSASFQWRAERPEVVSWKHTPQSFAAILEWRRRLTDCFSPKGNASIRSLERSTAAFGAERVREVAARYGADYIIVPIDPLLRPDTLPFECVYSNAAYAVCRIDEGR